MVDLTRGGVSRTSLALRGIGGVVVVLGAAVFAVLGGGEAFESDPTVSAEVPAAAGPVRVNSAVRYRGVVVGELAEVDEGTAGSRLTLRMDRSTLDSIPAGVRLRILPKTLFGDQYVELAGSAAGGRLEPGAEIAADTDAATVRIYHAYTRMFALLQSLRPAELQVALGTMADVLRGRGAELGETVDVLHDLSGRFDPAETVGELGEVAGLTEQLATAAPDLLATLDDAVVLSRAVVEERENLADLLGAGTELTERSQRFLDENAARAIEVVHVARPASEVLGGGADRIPETLRNLREFTSNASRTFVDDRFRIRAPVTLEDPHPYTPADCPRYPGLDGPHCSDATTYGGAVGSVGTDREKGELERMFADPVRAPAADESAAAPSAGSAPDADLLGLLFGPVVRGTQVVAP
ncbi:MCE family protein [Saccharopolyspora gloriosae]|uniref:Virulence factor Mce-like protein n=1 Tax=Saccharopolyspora gloriosae TaxID=455344 RepID=A0A840NGS5_9PSEU|nr:MCE family protein [Saccharopolyspora gloriosae]MBB5069285.1 virulence factor Mce-like protein [Saccharopolyspora gloriosae]